MYHTSQPEYTEPVSTALCHSPHPYCRKTNHTGEVFPQTTLFPEESGTAVVVRAHDECQTIMPWRLGHNLKVMFTSTDQCNRPKQQQQTSKAKGLASERSLHTRAPQPPARGLTGGSHPQGPAPGRLCHPFRRPPCSMCV
eukprot:scaffold6294_cov215-Prasinococcus_capsulatus_cf.AAC.1